VCAYTYKLNTWGGIDYKTVYKSGITAAGKIALTMDHLLCTVCSSMLQC